MNFSRNKIFFPIFPKKRIERSETPEPNFDSHTLEKYKEDLTKERRDLEELYLKFYEQPATHPSFKSEWVMFYEKRSLELIRVRIDPLNYDFDREWQEAFYKYLRQKQANEYAVIKKTLFDKYSRINKNQWRDRRDSKNESRSSRSSNRKSRSRSRNRFRSRSRSHHNHNRSSRRQTRSRSRSRSRDIKKQVKLEVATKGKEFGFQSRRHTVSKVCREVLKLDHKVKFKRDKVEHLMKKAIDFEEWRQREYTMTIDEHEFLLDLKDDLSYLIKNGPMVGRNVVNEINAIRNDLNVLCNRWKNFKERHAGFTSGPKYYNNNKIFFKGKKFSFKFAGKPKTRVETFTSRNYVSPWNDDDGWSASPASNPDLQNGNNVSHANEATTSTLTSLSFPVVQAPVVEQEINFLNNLKQIKKERTDAELELLKQEKKKLEELIMNESVVEPSIAKSAHSSQEELGLVIDETANVNVKDEMDDSMEEDGLTAADITDDELVELFKDFETSSQEELQFVQQIMEELEHTDPPRFKCLKAKMEEIQSSIEIEFMHFINDNYEQLAEGEICIKQEELTG